VEWLGHGCHLKCQKHKYRWNPSQSLTPLMNFEDNCAHYLACNARHVIWFDSDLSIQIEPPQQALIRWLYFSSFASVTFRSDVGEQRKEARLGGGPVYSISAILNSQISLQYIHSSSPSSCWGWPG
jgi:hypothetical protein